MAQKHTHEHGRWLARSLGSEKSLLFSLTVYIDASRNNPDTWIATIGELEEGTIIAAGKSWEEAEGNALDSFRGMVDYCIAEKRPLSELLGSAKASVMKEVPAGVEKLVKALYTMRRPQRRKTRSLPVQRPRHSAAAWLLGEGCAA